MHSISTLSDGVRVRVPDVIGKYRVVRTIGKGGFAVVVLGVNPKTEKQVAIKIIFREEVTKRNLMQYLENELRLSTRFDHPNVCKVLDVIYEEDIIMVVMEYFKNGDLQSMLSNGVNFTYEQKCKISFDILQGINYLHKRGISHRDIKPENVLLDDDFTPKLIDFGLAKENGTSLHTYCGTPFYMAPEVIISDTYDGIKADIWAFGVTVHVLSTGKFPWYVKNDVQLIRELQANKLELIIEPTGVLGTLISKCLVFDSKKRSSSSDLLTLLENYDYQPIQVIHKSLFTKKTSTDLILPHLSNIPKNNINLPKKYHSQEKGFWKIKFQCGRLSNLQ